MAGWGINWGNDPWGGEALSDPVDITYITVNYTPSITPFASLDNVANTCAYAPTISKTVSP